MSSQQKAEPTNNNSKLKWGSQKKKRGSCEVCHKAKQRCVFVEGQTKCKRCKRLNKDCFMHVSMQGKRPSLNTSNKNGNALKKNPPSPDSGARADGVGGRNQDDSANGNLKMLGAAYPITQGGQFATLSHQGLKGPGGQNCMKKQAAANNFNRHTGTDSSSGFGSSAKRGHSGYDNASAPVRLTEQQPDMPSYNISATISFRCNQRGTDLQSQPTCSADQQAPYILPLQNWIQGALRAVGNDQDGSTAIASPIYLQACLKVALSLAKQIKQTNVTIESAANWPIYAYVILKQKDKNIQSREESDAGEKTHVGRNRDVDSLLKEFGVAEFESKESDHQLSSRALLESLLSDTSFVDDDNDEVSIELGTIQELDSNKKTIGFEMLSDVANNDDVDIYHIAKAEDHEHSTFSTKTLIESPATTELDLLDVESANLQCPGIKQAGINASNDEVQRIYFLGLLFYTLFSGGQTPSEELHTLVSSDGAFVSLSKLTLMQRNSNHGDKQGELKRHQGSSRARDELGLCHMSCEYLSFFNVPAPISNLVLNMMECVYGEFGGEEVYTNIADLCSDLELLSTEPHLLRGIDTEKLSLTGLQMNEVIVSRTEEYDSVISSYKRYINEPCHHVAIIAGESGSGKSWLSRKVAEYIQADGGVFLTSKFDNMGQEKPLCALSMAFDKYCDLILQKKDSDWANKVVTRLQLALGQDAASLLGLIPKLGLVLGNDASAGTAEFSFSGSCRNAVQRMYFLICKFMEAICSDSSVTLLLDDTQWADDASIDLLNQLLRRHQIKFFLIVCSRDHEIGGGDPFLNMLGNLHSFGVGSTVTKLGSIDQDEVKAVMSKALCLLPRQVKTLASIVHKRTKGLILFVMQLILSLEHDGLLHIDLGRKRWVWDQDKIESMRLPENVAICFAQKVHWLSPAVRAAIHLLSMFGHSTRLDILKCIGARLNMNVTPLLQQAEMEGLVNNVGGCISFSHDRIKRAAYEMISEQNRLANHLVYGQCLIELADQTNDDDVMFLAVKQINIAGSGAANTDKHVAFAEYNMRAGKRAMQMSQFSYAYSLFNHGLSFLDQTNHWNDHYDFSLELYELSCRCALVVGDVLGLQVLSDKVMTHARNSDDTIKTQMVVMSSMAFASKIADALHLGLAILAQLGEEISTDPTQAELDQEALRTTNLLVTSSLHEIFNYPTMSCFRKVAAMRILAQIQIIALFVNPPLQALIIMKMVNMTISHGLSAPSSIGFAGFASYVSKLGNLALGKSFCKLARAIIDRVDGAVEFAGETIVMVSEVECYFEPLLAANEHRIEGEKLASSSGDVHFACLNRLQYCICLLIAGVNLNGVKDKVAKACQFMKEHDHKTTEVFMLLHQRTVNHLVGEVSVSDVAKSVRENKNPHQHRALAYHNLYLAYIFNQEDLLACCVQFFELEVASRFLVMADSYQAFYCSLACYRLRRKTRDPVWLSRANERAQNLKLWYGNECSWNFQHRLQLLSAEEHFCIGDFQAAIGLYKRAISIAAERRFQNDLALAYELAAICFMESGDLVSSLEHYRLAREKYIDWGAEKKAQDLLAFMSSTIDRRDG